MAAGRAAASPGFQYVAINLVGSTLFLFAVGLIYAVTGTLNMADLAVKVPQVAPGDRALLRAGGAAAVARVRHQGGAGAAALVAADGLRRRVRRPRRRCSRS